MSGKFPFDGAMVPSMYQEKKLVPFWQVLTFLMMAF